MPPTTPAEDPGNSALKVSIAVPARNEGGSLASLLDSLLNQTQPFDEVVIADGGSTDATVVVAKQYEGRGVRVLELGPAFPGRGRNEAIRAARNDWIALIDAGCVAERQWLESLTRARQAGPEARIVYGNYEPRLETEWDVAQALVLVPPIDPATACRPPFIASCLIHRSAWSEVGGFSEELRAAEDLLFFRRVTQAGIATARSPTAVIRWQLAATPVAFFRRLRLYSAYHLAGGLHGTWHLRVMTMDAAALVLAVASFFWPLAAVLLVIGMAGRLLHTVSERRSNVPDRRAFRLTRLARAAVLLGLADLATWAGFLDFLESRVLGRPLHG